MKRARFSEKLFDIFLIDVINELIPRKNKYITGRDELKMWTESDHIKACIPSGVINGDR